MRPVCCAGDPGWCEIIPEIQRLGQSNRESRAIDIIGELPRLSNPSEGLENENPGALGGATGANLEAANFTRTAYRKRGGNAMSRHAKDRHKRVARMVGYALTAGDPATWGGLSSVVAIRLTPLEIASLAFAALRALEPHEREAVHNAAQWGVV